MSARDHEQSTRGTRTTYIGGQAVMEGVMMRGRSCAAIAVRAPGGGVETQCAPSGGLASKYRLLRLPIIRGVVNFAASLVDGMRALYKSADMAGLSELEDEEPSKFDKWLEAKLGDKLTSWIMAFSAILAVVLCVGLFMVAPAALSSLFTPLLAGRMWALGIIESAARIVIFMLYMVLISRMKEVARTFEYHGAEHKTINCYEHNQELTVENVRAHSRLHKRCGTSFLLIVMVVSIIVFLFVRTDTLWLRILSRVLLVPLIAGLSYEVIRWAGRSDSALVRAISWPGMKLQLLTTHEPDDAQLEVAIAAMKAVLEREGDGLL